MIRQGAFELVASTSAASSPSRKIRRLGIAVLAVVALYSAGWYFVASEFEAFLGRFLNKDSNGVTLECGNLATGGFPFLIGFTCDRTGIDDPGTGSRAAAGPFRAAARIYNPGAAIVELEGPADFVLPDGSTIEARWSSLRSSLHASLSGLNHLSLQGDEPALRLNAVMLYEPFDFRARQGELHLRNQNGDLDMAAIAHDFEWKLASGEAVLPRLSTSADLRLDGRGELLSGQPANLRPASGELRSFRIETADGLYGEMSGPFTIDAEGLISGTFRTTFEKIDMWDTTLRRLFPGAGDTISALAALLKGLAKGEDRVTVNLKVDRGLITLSLLPLGRIPPL